MDWSEDNGSTPSRGSDVRTAFAAVLGLSCMFGGIWLSDGQLLGTNGSEAGTLAMRVCTCVVYFAFFLIARRFSRRGDGDVRWLFGVSATVGIALFAAGALCILLVMPGLERGCAAWMTLGILSLFMVKIIGAPVSVGLVCLFARLDGAMVVRSCTLGMLGAFALYSLVSQHSVAAALGGHGIVGVAGALLCASLLLAMLGFGGAPVGLGPEKRPPVLAALSVPGVVKRPMAKVVTPGFIITLVFSAMMLGFCATASPAAIPMATPCRSRRSSCCWLSPSPGAGCASSTCSTALCCAPRWASCWLLRLRGRCRALSR